MLAVVNKPFKLDKLALALQLKEALRAESCRAAVCQVVDQVFSTKTPLNVSLHATIVQCDIEGCKATSVAAQLGVSLRTLFRWRSIAVMAIASAIDQLLDTADSASNFTYTMARMIAPLESATAVRLLEREAPNLGGRAAYDAVTTAVRNGSPVSDALLAQCTGQWRVLAELEIARSNLVRGDPAAYETLRTGLSRAIASTTDASAHRLGFELAYIDRLNALRFCDVDATADATTRMSRNTGNDPTLLALAMVSEVEQACDEGDLARAETTLRKLQLLCSRLRDFRITARTSHVYAILQMLRGRYSDAIELAHAALAALRQVEPEFAACSAGNAGRAALFIGQPWQRPLELCERFPQSYVTGYVDAVWARHLVFSDPELALTVIDRSLDIVARQEARGVLVYARATKALVLDRLGRATEARRLRMLAWEQGVTVRRLFYLYDLFAHPAIVERDYGPFDYREFRSALRRRAHQLSSGSDRVAALAAEIAYSVLRQYRSATGATQLRTMVVAPEVDASALVTLSTEERITLRRAVQQLASDVSYALAPADRAAFVEKCAASMIAACETSDQSATSIAT